MNVISEYFSHLRTWYDLGWAVLYLIGLLISIKVLLENRNPQKTVSYLLLLLFFPAVGIPIYYFFGSNQRSRRKYNIKKLNDAQFFINMKKDVIQQSEKVIKSKSEFLNNQTELARLLVKDSLALLSCDNKVELLINGENKFPEIITALEQAQSHIHIEYYIYENDEIGNKVKSILIRKSREGVKIRFIYDDFGSRSIRKKFAAELRNAGIEIYPFYKTHFAGLANRWNNRNHRKIIVIDGKVGFTGGINIADYYQNSIGKKKRYWRDTHLKMEGSSVATLQIIFISDWNFCTGHEIDLADEFFPGHEKNYNQIVQVASSGPDSERATIMLAFFTAIVCAVKKVYITTPYFIPNESILTALKQAALSGIDVRLLVPETADSIVVNAATCSFFTELLEAGVRIFLYTKGFVHAKTMVVDDNLAIVGTANMDMRSFDFNFEVNAFVYDSNLNKKLENNFNEDLKETREVVLKEWTKRSKWFFAGESIVRLFAPLL